MDFAQADDPKVIMEKETSEILISDATFLAMGAEGEVYSGTWNGRHVAVKKCFDKLFEELVELRRLRHHNIIQILAVGTWKESMALVMEYCGRGSLGNILKKEEHMGYEHWLKWAREIPDGMDYLHRKNVIHRDLKPENILVTTENEIRISDFGASREKILLSHSASWAATSLTHMAPELLWQNCSSTKVDVWSYGVVLWEMLTGQEPLVDLTAKEIIVGLCEKNIKFKIPPLVPNTISQLLGSCISYIYHDRPAFSDILDLVDDIYAEVSMKREIWQSFARKDQASTNKESKKDDMKSILLSLIPSLGSTTTHQEISQCIKCFNRHPEDTTSCSLFDAVENNDLSGVVNYLEQPDADVAIGERRMGKTPLHLAAQCGFSSIVAVLLKADEKNKKVEGSSENEWTKAKTEPKENENAPIHLAASANHVEIVRMFLDHGVDVNLKDGEWWTPLQWAVRYKTQDAVKFLLDRGADAEHVNKGGQAAIHMASRQNCEAVVKLLLEQGVDVNTLGAAKWTPLHHAAISGMANIVRILIEHGADLTLKNDEGDAPIHLACELNQAEVIKVILEECRSASQVNLRARNGRTPLHYAAVHYAVDAAEILLKRGADASLKDQNHISATRKPVLSSNTAPKCPKSTSHLPFSHIIIMACRQLGADRSPPSFRKRKFHTPCSYQQTFTAFAFFLTSISVFGTSRRPKLF